MLATRPTRRGLLNPAGVDDAAAPPDVDAVNDNGDGITVLVVTVDARGLTGDKACTPVPPPALPGIATNVAASRGILGPAGNGVHVP